MNNLPHHSPLHNRHRSLEAFFLPYGSAEDPSQVVETFGDLDMEYAAIRKGCVIFDQPHMGTLRISGADRTSFLNNMLTAELKALLPGTSRWAFWLNRKGRIDADLRLAQRASNMLVALDRHLCQATAKTLGSFVFTEDVVIEEASEQFHRIALHGPTGCTLIEHASTTMETPIEKLDEHTNTQITIEGSTILVERADLAGEIGLELCIPVGDVVKVYDRLIEVADQHPGLKARPSGWLAINTARIEAGHPMFNLDFGATNLPIESGIFDQRVSTTKGCYLGQEVVARMHARHACNKRVVALKIEGQQITSEHQDIHQPITGSQLFEPGKEGETPVGHVTSSTISPMLGAVPICLAMVKSPFFEPGTTLSVSAEGKLVPCTVQESLGFWKKPDAHLPE